MHEQKSIQRPLNTIVYNTLRGVFKYERILLINIRQDHSISMQDDNNNNKNKP